jgi:DHA2 family multidrug resistance protein-like MFS transporter
MTQPLESMHMGEPGITLAGRREWVGLAVIALPCLLTTMDMTVLTLAVPAVSADLAPTAAQLLWIVDMYGFVIAGSLVTMGTLGDRIGRRRLLLIGAFAFGAASVLAAFAQTAAMLIAARAILGVAGATLAPSTLSLIRSMFVDDRQRTVAISVWTTSFAAGAAIGPFVGGALLEHFWWGSVFLVAVPVMALLLLLGPKLLPEYRDPAAGRLDLLSAAMSLASVLVVIYGLKRFAERGPGGLAVASVVAGFVVGALFLRRQRRLVDPFLDLALFRVRAFGIALATFMLSLFVLVGVFLFFAQYLQLVLGLSPFHAGMLTVPSSVGLVVGSMLTPIFVRRAPPRVVMTCGLALGAVGSAVIAYARGPSVLGILVAGSVALAFGVAPVGTLATDLIVGIAPPERAGAASAISETSAELGGALGIAVLGSVGAAIYRRAMPSDLALSGLPRGSEAARATLGATVALAKRLPDALGAPLLIAARDAFTLALHVTAGVGCAVLLTAAVLSGIGLRAERRNV